MYASVFYECTRMIYANLHVCVPLYKLCSDAQSLAQYLRLTEVNTEA